MNRNTMNSVNRITVPVLAEAELQNNDPPTSVTVLNFERSDAPGYVRVFYNGEWRLVAGASILNMLIYLCPTMDQTKPPIPPRPLRPIP